MKVNYADIPVADERHLRQRTQPPRPSRRAVLSGVLGAATVGAFGALNAVNATVAKAAYWQDFTSTTSGPCGAGGYASTHTEENRKCGPSLQCSACCWPWASSGSNQQGWHRTGPDGATEYWHRPDDCWVDTYDSWRWKYSDGRTYRCSDGYRFNSTGTTKTICPYAV